MALSAALNATAMSHGLVLRARIRLKPLLEQSFTGKMRIFDTQTSLVIAELATGARRKRTPDFHSSPGSSGGQPVCQPRRVAAPLGRMRIVTNQIAPNTPKNVSISVNGYSPERTKKEVVFRFRPVSPLDPFGRQRPARRAYTRLAKGVSGLLGDSLLWMANKRLTAASIGIRP